MWIDDSQYQGAFDFPSFPLDSSPRVCLGKGLDGELGPCYFFREGVSEEVLRDLPPAAAIWHPLQTLSGAKAATR